MKGFVAGAMTAVAAFCLIIPAMEASAYLGRGAFFPAFAGAWCGILLVMLLDGISENVLRRVGKGAVMLIPLAFPLPWLSGVCAGGMLCVAVKNLIPSMDEADRGAVFFGLGFTLVMVLFGRP